MARAHKISQETSKRIGDLFDALHRDDKEALARLETEDPDTDDSGSSEAREQPTGSARKEASPET